MYRYRPRNGEPVTLGELLGDVGPAVLSGDGEIGLLLRPEQSGALASSLAQPGGSRTFVLTRSQCAALGWQWDETWHPDWEVSFEALCERLERLEREGGE